MQTYIVQSGDTLSDIASRFNTSVDELLKKNEQVNNRDYIQVGWKIRVPSAQDRAGFPEPKTDAADPASDSAVSAPCSECVVDVIHVTGSPDETWCEALPESAAEEFHREVDAVQALMDEYRALSKEVPEPDSADYEQKIIEHRGKKSEWLKKAVDAGLLERNETDEAGEALQISERQKLEAQLAEIREEIRFYENYRPFSMLSPGRIQSDANTENENWKLLQQEKLNALAHDEANIERALSAHPADSSLQKQQKLTETGPKKSSEDGASEYAPFSDGVAAEDMSGKGAAASSTRKSGKGGQARIVEVMLFSRGNRLSYVRADFLQQFRTKHRLLAIRKTVKIASMLTGGRSKLSIGDLVGQVKEQIEADRRKGKLGDVGVKLAEWTLNGKDNPEWVQFLQSEHETLWKTNLVNGTSDETTTMALDSEGHFMRFAAAASADIEGLDPSTGSFDVGFNANASMSLLEGKVEFTGYMPNKAGWDCNWTYIDANGQQARQSFGKFRFEGQTVLSCFVGAKVSGQAKVGVSGANMLLSSAPGIESEASELGAGAKVSGNAFAGAEAGGELAGKLGWKPPVKAGEDKKAFSDLLELKASGLVAFGAGAGLDFEFKVGNDFKTEIHSRAKVVFGPGASGGFGTVIDGAKVWTLSQMIWDILQDADYRFLMNVQKDLFAMLAKGLAISLVEHGLYIRDLYEEGLVAINSHWSDYLNEERAASKLAEQLLSGGWRPNVRRDDGSSLPLGKLPPETLGPLCWRLSESFAFSFETNQEKALIYLLSHINSWRQFIEVLEHMEKEGKKVGAFESLARLQAILDFRQQEEFDRWIHRLQAARSGRKKLEMIWSPVSPGSKLNQVKEQLAYLENIDTRIV
ncbi:LysM peptidoglycan-binding domain-containing protein [Marinobacter confluentis]|uniref:LysM peptidoglycan-binding domain-containing protein n=1 Tax=Marinobacter confluentis TaxID=1697557 RepID=A0A4Z1BGL7_9GAMM|nr:LysM domain-containing protein [Marinobacter confluentis]TGN38506.1 LysM peptidoglycan-binding domain-containing protein [Marinobacter confluentis]